jgi:hypothetical protein
VRPGGEDRYSDYDAHDRLRDEEDLAIFASPGTLALLVVPEGRCTCPRSDTAPRQKSIHGISSLFTPSLAMVRLR